jgi:hypothetical protein
MSYFNPFLSKKEQAFITNAVHSIIIAPSSSSLDYVKIGQLGG